MKKCLFSLFVFFSINAFSQADLKAVRVNEKRMEERIAGLATFGKDSIGRSYRVAFSKADIAGRAYVMSLMQQAGLEPTIDYAGNIIGKRKGKDPAKKTIAFGSHIDMVPDGGNYDGCVGSLGAIEVIEMLNQNKITTTHPLELIIFCDEEGGTVGSRAIAGEFNKESFDAVTHSGLTIKEGIKAIGGKPDRINEAAIAKGASPLFLNCTLSREVFLKEKNCR